MNHLLQSAGSTINDKIFVSGLEQSGLLDELGIFQDDCLIDVTCIRIPGIVCYQPAHRMGFYILSGGAGLLRAFSRVFRRCRTSAMDAGR